MTNAEAGLNLYEYKRLVCERLSFAGEDFDTSVIETIINLISLHNLITQDLSMNFDNKRTSIYSDLLVPCGAAIGIFAYFKKTYLLLFQDVTMFQVADAQQERLAKKLLDIETPNEQTVFQTLFSVLLPVLLKKEYADTLLDSGTPG